ncbi:hypothetical protein MKK75_06655 [Methylobacterium sp. J-030]|uniref:hypothetical protein n=1 Tax=Methylobacterium sp. J-030 TaxID=2836627 RepID=UPI001FBBBDF7|nr:hypothetical protein [Methylobacterium sp. J-030]MCJ2068489.1 hypothetical protein [Methylobacterium sp. J-030]
MSPNTVTRAEADLPVNTSTLAVLRRALEAKGARFGSDGSVVAHAIGPKGADPIDTRAEARAAAKAAEDAAEVAAADDSLWQDERKA